MKNFQKIALGLMTVGSAFAFSAFTNVDLGTNKKAVTFDYLVQRAAGQFTQINPSNPSATPDYSFCKTSAANRCSYEVTLLGKSNMPTLVSLGQTSYTATQIQDYLDNGYIIEDPETTKSTLYVD
ncbi:hypothetical protein [Pedobacter gandavensis]|uniref:hypothetical protein n=1 Tax=Pedobacter gandavensis TaxID=2679963 RepID=UPI00292D8E21|nr:hypothetical protein [Pedobacter gandavensis]